MGQDPSEIRHEIETTRAQLGETVEALSYKADVPSRVKDAVNDRVEGVTSGIGDALATAQTAAADATARVAGGLGSTPENAPRTPPPVLSARSPLWIALAALAIVVLARVLLSHPPGDDDGTADAVP
jgi:hypothetical protein